MIKQHDILDFLNVYEFQPIREERQRNQLRYYILYIKNENSQELKVFLHRLEKLEKENQEDWEGRLI